MAEMRDSILERLDNIDDLPTLPVVMVKLSKALENIDCCTEDIVRILSSDPVISAQILKTVNSPLFSRTGKKEKNLKTAITRLGFREVKNIALSTSVFNMFSGLKDRLFDRAMFWQHCLATSLIAIEIAKIKNLVGAVPADELHLAGLVHDLGKVILDAYFAEEFETALQVAIQMKLPLYEAERIALGIDHAELGYMIAEKWNLPAFAVESIRYHHEPELADAAYRDIVDIVHIANYMANTQELGASGDIAAPVFHKTVLDEREITAAELQELVRVAQKEKANISHIV